MHFAFFALSDAWFRFAGPRLSVNSFISRAGCLAQAAEEGAGAAGEASSEGARTTREEPAQRQPPEAAR